MHSAVCIASPPRRARATALTAPVPTLTPAETARFRLWCSLLDPVGKLTPAERGERARRIQESREAWRVAISRVER